MKKDTVLVIEDDRDTLESICAFLTEAQFETIAAANGTQGLAALSGDVSLIILDIMMPDISGIELCRRIRTFSYVPIIFLTAKTEEADVLSALASGGDEYMTKPFSYPALVARVNAVLRRSREYTKESEHSHDDDWCYLDRLRICQNQNLVYDGDSPIELTQKEYLLLLLFVQNPKKIFSVEELYEAIWEEQFIPDDANTVMVHIRRLRSKIEKHTSTGKVIVTIWGKGYCLDTRMER